MSNEKIYISFDKEDGENRKNFSDKNENSLSDSDKIEIEIHSDKNDSINEKLIIADLISDEVKVPDIKLPVNSFLYGNSGCNKYYESNLKFPAGIDSGFRKKFAVELNAKFFSSVLQTN
ncbi:hypothetical protein ABQG68_19405, partial [Bacillus pumilus]|uniref:hypothetical protein n=1 Tax=Bacillus pumilus TaxID=1408 RepID=UPI003315E9B7